MDDNVLNAARIPVATYRLQFNGGFGFSAARENVSYLFELGISDLYASPYFKARSGSLHGYDIVDPTSLNPEVGGEGDYAGLVKELHSHGMGQVLDIVPNHMCIASSDNAWWMDLLENGPSSVHAGFFDIDWEPVKRELKDKVLFPILGDQYGAVLENGELALVFADGSFFLQYYDRTLPIRLKSYSAILTHRLGELEQSLSPDDTHYQELLSIDTALRNLPPHTERDPERIVERYREKEVIKRRLSTLYNEAAEIREFIDRNVTIFNGNKGEPASFDLLDELLRQQVYRLSHWRVATEEINYRRFFDINELAAIRMENPAVFTETHRLVLRLVREGKVTGLRVDHMDGLYNPTDYLGRLQKECFLQRELGQLEHAAGRKLTEEEERERETELLRRHDELLAADPGYKPFYIIGEKILTKGEKLPEEWPVFGTTGYEFANLVTGLFVDAMNAKALDAIYTRFTGGRMNYGDTVYERKKLIMQVAMSGEINALGYHLNTISEVNRHTRDFTLNSLIKALVEVIAFFPVYRTYTSGPSVADRDRQFVEYAVTRAKRKNPAINVSIFDFIKDVLLLRFYPNMGERETAEWVEFVMRFQQITGPVMAKGVEDSAFYVYNRLVSLNEVGGSPERFGSTLEAFHGQNVERGRSRPLALLATSTHDTKRSEDVRSRICVLSEIPDRWRAAITRWSRLNSRKKVRVDGQPVPGRNEEYLLYQTLVGAWPIEPATAEEFASFRKRIGEYMVKAVREAKESSSWISPNFAYEEALSGFIAAILSDASDNRFLADIREFQQITSYCGKLNSLSGTLLKITSPGIPDFYQGSELWDFSLVDPDNRRPVDFAIRKRALAELKGGEAAAGPLTLARMLAADMRDGRIKLYLICQALKLRNDRLRLFEKGQYTPLPAAGERADNVCAFARSDEGGSVVVVAPRFFTRLVRHPGDAPLGREVWQGTRIVLPAGQGGDRYRNVFTGEVLEPARQEDGSVLHLSDIISDFPVALLERVTE